MEFKLAYYLPLALSFLLISISEQRLIDVSKYGLNDLKFEQDQKSMESTVFTDMDLPNYYFVESDKKCFLSLDDEFCSEDMLRAKDIIRMALNDHCTGCTPVERKFAGKIAATMMFDYPETWRKFLEVNGAWNQYVKDYLGLENYSQSSSIED